MSVRRSALSALLVALCCLAWVCGASVSEVTWDAHPLEAPTPAVQSAAAASSLFPHVISSDDLSPSDDEWDDPNSIKHIMQTTGPSTGSNVNGNPLVLSVQSFNVSQCIPAPVLLSPPVQFASPNSTAGAVTVTVSLTGYPALNSGMYGLLSVQTQPSSSITLLNSTGMNQAGPISFTATSLFAANEALASLTYTPAQGLQDTSMEVFLQVSASLVNDPSGLPAFSVSSISFSQPTSYTPIEILPIDAQSFANLTAAGNTTVHIPAIQVVNLVNPDDELSVTITQLNGFVTLLYTDNLIFANNPYANTVNFVGHLSDVNAALANITWTSVCPSGGGCASTAYGGFTVTVRDFGNNTECPSIAVLDCTLDVAPNGLSIIEAALPKPVVTQVLVNNQTAYNVSWVTLQSLGWSNGGFSSDPTAYALMITSNPQTYGFTQVYYGLGTSFLLTNLTTGTTYTVEVEIYSTAGLSTCPGYTSTQTGRSVCAPNPTTFSTAGVSPNSALVSISGSSSTTLSFTTQLPLNGALIDSVVATVYSGNSSTGLVPLSTPFVIIPVEVAGGAIVNVITGLTPFTPYTVVVQTRNAMGFGPAASATGWTLLNGPAIIGFVASDPQNRNTVVESGDVLTLTFDQPTNQPAVSSRAAIDALLAFSQPLADDYTGAWSSPSTLTITLTTVSTQTPAVGVETVTVVGNLRSADLVSDASTASAVLTGNWGTLGLAPYFVLPSAPLTVQENAQAFLGVSTNFPATVLADVSTTYTLSVQLLMPVLSGASLSGSAVWSTPALLISTSGTAAALQSVLSSVLFTSAPGYFGPASFQYQLLLSATNALVAEVVQVVQVTHSNHVPIIEAPASLSVVLEQVTALPGVSVADVDVALGSTTDSMTVTLSATSGGLLSWSGVAVSGVSYAPSFSLASPVYQLTGPLAAVNVALQSLQAYFEYAQTAFGAATQPFVLLTVNDHGNGGQPALTNAQQLYVAIACPSNASLVQPTQVLSAELSDSGNELVLTLSLPMTADVLSAPFVDCLSVFADLSSLGASRACHWINTAQLQVELGVGATVSPMSAALQVVANAFPRCGGVPTPSSAASVSVTASPTASLSPVSISGPSMASLCEDVTLTATAFAASAHALSYNWTLPAEFAQVDAAQQIGLSAASVTVPAALFSSFTSQPVYTFSLTVTDFLGFTQTATFNVEMDHDAKPLLQPLTPTTVTAHVEDALDLLTVASVPSCTAAPAAPPSASSASAITFSWTVAPALSGVALGSASSLHLPAGVLSYYANAEHSYTFTLMATMADNAFQVSELQFTVLVLPSALEARIAGGALVTIAPTAALTVDASTSFDAVATSATSASEYTFAWSCVSAAPAGVSSDAACYGSDGNVLALPNAAVLPFSAGLLTTNAYTFTLLYTHVPTGRTSTAAQTVQVSEPYLTAVSLSISGAATVINAGDKLALSAHASGPAAITWSVLGSGASHRALPLTVAVNASSMSALVLNAVESAAFFESGATYAFQASAVTAAGDSSSAAFALYVNAAPTCAQSLSVTLTSSDSTGVALQSGYVLSIAASSCTDVDALETDALLFQFFRVDPVSGLYYWLSAASPVSATSEVVLPTGASVVVGVRVLDRLGGYSEYRTSVAVAAPQSATASSLLAAYQAQSLLASQNGDAVTVASSIASVLATAASAGLSSGDLQGMKDALLTDLLTLSSSLPDDYITNVLALVVADPASTSASAAKYALAFVAALSAGDSMAASVDELRAVVSILDGVVGLIGSGQGSTGGARRRLLASPLDAATLNALNTELFASINSLAVDVSTQLLTVEGDSQPISASQWSGLMQRSVIGGSPFSVRVAGSTLTVPTTAALSSVAAAGTPFDVAVFVTPSASFDYVAQVGQVSEVFFVGAYQAALYQSPLAPHSSTSSLVAALPASVYANATVTFDLAYSAAQAGSCLNTVDAVTGLVCSLECRQWNGTAFSAAGVVTDFLALNTAAGTARCVVSQPGVLSLFQASEAAAVLSTGTGASSTGAASADQSAAVRASVTFPAPFVIANMKDFKQGLVQDLSAVSGEPAARFNVEQVTTNSQNGLTTVIIDIWVPTEASQASSQDVYVQLAGLQVTAVLTTSYLRYADLSSWMEQCSDMVFRANCYASQSSQSSWMLPLIISASVAGFLLCCALTVFAVRRYYTAPAKDKALEEFTLPTAGGSSKQYIYSPPTVGKELDAEISRHEEVSDVTIVGAANSGIDPHTQSSHSGRDEEISEPVIVESEAEAAELAKGLSDSRTQQDALSADLEDDEKEFSATGSVSGQSRHFYYVDESVNKGSRGPSELSTTSQPSVSSRSASAAPKSRVSVSAAAAAPASRSHFRVSSGAAQPALASADLQAERSVSASVSTSRSAGGAAHFRYSDNEDAASTSRTPSLPQLSHSPSHSVSSAPTAATASASFHTFSQLDLDQQSGGSTAAAPGEKKPIKVIRPGQH